MWFDRLSKSVSRGTVGRRIRLGAGSHSPWGFESAGESDPGLRVQRVVEKGGFELRLRVPVVDSLESDNHWSLRAPRADLGISCAAFSSMLTVRVHLICN